MAVKGYSCLQERVLVEEVVKSYCGCLGIDACQLMREWAGYAEGRPIPAAPPPPTDEPDDVKPDDDEEDQSTVLCPICRGKGRDHSGAKCSRCNGTGRVRALLDDEDADEEEAFSYVIEDEE
jgi:hypothetical protein